MIENFVTLLNKQFRLDFRNQELENIYHKRSFKEYLPQNILAAKISIFLYIFYAPLTYILSGNEAKLLTGVVLISISGPIALILFHKKKFFLKNSYIYLFLAALIAGFGPSLYYLFTENDRAIFQVDLLIPIIAIFTMYGVGFALALITVFANVAIFIILAQILQIPNQDVMMALYTALFTILISAVAAYLLEQSRRKLFIAKEESDDFRFLIDQSSDYIAFYDIDTYKYLYANKQVLNENGYTLREIRKKTISDVHPTLTPEKVKHIFQTLYENKKFSQIIQLENKNAMKYYIHVRLQYGYYKFKRVIINLSSDVTKLKEAELKIKEMADKDPLTKLYNRYKLNEYILQNIELYKRYKTPLSLIICDIDDFKHINDTYGHIIGDEVLKKIANTIKNSTRQIDIVSRWGGEEFAILLPNTTLKNAIDVANKVNKEIANSKHNNVDHVYISCGVAELKEQESQTEWFSRADTALYDAKEGGKNRVNFNP